MLFAPSQTSVDDRLTTRPSKMAHKSKSHNTHKSSSSQSQPIDPEELKRRLFVVLAERRAQEKWQSMMPKGSHRRTYPDSDDEDRGSSDNCHIEVAPSDSDRFVAQGLIGTVHDATTKSADTKGHGLRPKSMSVAAIVAGQVHDPSSRHKFSSSAAAANGTPAVKTESLVHKISRKALNFHIEGMRPRSAMGTTTTTEQTRPSRKAGDDNNNNKPGKPSYFLGRTVSAAAYSSDAISSISPTSNLRSINNVSHFRTDSDPDIEIFHRTATQSHDNESFKSVKNAPVPIWRRASSFWTLNGRLGKAKHADRMAGGDQAINENISSNRSLSPKASFFGRFKR